MAATRDSKIMSRRDLEFLLYEWLDVERLTDRPRFEHCSRDVFDAVLELSELLAENEFAPHNQKNDTEEPWFDGDRVHVIPEVGAALRSFAEAGLIGATLDTTIDGSQLPQVVYRACMAWLQAANSATVAYPILTTANINLLYKFGDADQLTRFVIPMVEGRFFGTMCLSEPQAGSSLADITTSAVPQADGTYRLFGSKMWISGGDHDITENIVHLVLARVAGAPAGIRGLSLFVVPKRLVDGDAKTVGPNDVVLGGLNHKMGSRGTTNAVLNFGEGVHLPESSPGAIGYLVGEENRGLGYMFHMMNEARLFVGAGAMALGYTGYLHALDYARSRPQGRPPGEKDPAAPQQPIIRHADVRRMLLAGKSYVEGGLALVLYCARLLDEIETSEDAGVRERAAALLDALTPIAKSWPAKWCLEANDLAIQILGGYGYTRDYPVEQFYRDNRLNAIHEGTEGIQAIDLLGRRLVIDEGRGLRALEDAIGESIQRAPDSLSPYASQLRSALDRITVVTGKLWAQGDPRLALANATLFADAVGHVVAAWMWLEQLSAAAGKPGDFYEGKRAAGHYFFSYELPRIDVLLDLVESLDTQLIDLNESWL